MPDAVDLIRVKRDGGKLADADIRWLIGAYTAGTVAEEQMSALLMAIYFNGLDPSELAAWTDAMISSGERLDLASIPAPGGTLDKLEAIPGWRAALSNTEIVEQLRTTGCVICAAGSGLAPADRRLYALRDVTGTVESIPLIASSIMSKKIAEGTSALVLDVKVGSGAFMRELGAARQLAHTMVELGNAHGVRTSALLTRMDIPLGRAVGNGVEVEESETTLRGEGPPDLVAVTLALAAEMLWLAGISADPAAALADGRALAKYRAMIAAQGGDPDGELPAARFSEVVPAPRSGRLSRLDARAVGVAAWPVRAGSAGAGRRNRGRQSVIRARRACDRAHQVTMALCL